MIDTHAHLDACAEDAEDLVEAAGAAGVTRIVTIGREQAVDLAARLPEVWAAVGWHPHEAGEVADVGAVEPLLAHPRVVAVGECGLDYYRDLAPRDEQLRVFESQVEMANRAGKPLVIHTRDADQDTFRVLEAAAVPVAGRIESPVTVEGGDTVWLDDATLLVGIGYRTNAAAVEALQAAFPGVEVIAFDLPHWNGAGEV
ncbi:MAG TPA: TatD family hydrolase, partial [Gaiellales bacterium]|nr:TatD family hydrolase [Gaiellales bacterium]